jgi:checkpoint serine/threonine-protein kinase
VTVHAQTGKKEYIFVDLEAVYPAPDVPGSELSFEEIIASRRGWLNQSWDHETLDENLVPEPVHCLNDIEEISRAVNNKLAIHRDPILFDENGEMRELPREPRVAKKKKVMETNETQISKMFHQYGPFTSGS